MAMVTPSDTSGVIESTMPLSVPLKRSVIQGPSVTTMRPKVAHPADRNYTCNSAATMDSITQISGSPAGVAG